MTSLAAASGSTGGDASGSVGGSADSSTGSAAATAVRWANNELGKSYVWVAGGPDHFDCSGLTMYIYAKAGIYLPHSSQAQFGSVATSAATSCAPATWSSSARRSTTWASTSVTAR